MSRPASAAASEVDVTRPRVMFFIVFDRFGKQLFYRGWGVDARTDLLAIDEHAKLVFGVVFSLKQMVPSLSKDEDAGVRSLTTSAFTLHVFEPATGYRFVLCTYVANAKQQADAQLFLEDVYVNLFVDLVMQDPTYEPGGKIFSTAFAKSVEMRLNHLFAR
jgi:hypothetical protein